MSRQCLPRRACRDTRPYQKSPSAEGTPHLHLLSFNLVSFNLVSSIFYHAMLPPPRTFRIHARRLLPAPQPADIFGNDHPLEIDLGCGDGSFLIEMAQHYPERNFLGVERLLGRVRGVCKRIQELGLTNVMVLRLESQYTLEYLLAPASVSRLHLLCPDPWPKARHHKRRLVQQEFLHILQKTLSPGGEFLFKTDHPEYYEWVLEQVESLMKRTLTNHSPATWPR